MNEPLSTARTVCLYAPEIEARRGTLSNTFAHELGHVYGRSEAPADADSVMAFGGNRPVSKSDLQIMREELE